MTGKEFEDQFEVQFNNITSNQAPGLNTYEKCVFLTKAQDELTKNHFLAQSNPKQAGFDANQKRQMDFSRLMRTYNTDIITQSSSTSRPYGVFDPRGIDITWPDSLFLVVNETLHLKEWWMASAYEKKERIAYQRQVIPLSYSKYTELMSKPYKEPLKNQAWRLCVSGEEGASTIEIIAHHNDLHWVGAESSASRQIEYNLRYIRRPKPIITSPIDSYGMTIGGKDGRDDALYTLSDDEMFIINPCELDESLHEEILQRAVELAKIAWQGDVKTVVEAGNRSE